MLLVETWNVYTAPTPSHDIGVEGIQHFVGQSPLNSSACVKSRSPDTCSVAPVPTRSSTNSFTRNLVSLASVTSAQSHPECACSSIEVPMLSAGFQMRSNQEVEVELGLCCCSSCCCCLVAQQSLPRPPQRRDNLAACVLGYTFEILVHCHLLCLPICVTSFASWIDGVWGSATMAKSPEWKTLLFRLCRFVFSYLHLQVASHARH